MELGSDPVWEFLVQSHLKLGLDPAGAQCFH